MYRTRPGSFEPKAVSKRNRSAGNFRAEDDGHFRFLFERSFQLDQLLDQFMTQLAFFVSDPAQRRGFLAGSYLYVLRGFAFQPDFARN